MKTAKGGVNLTSYELMLIIFPQLGEEKIGQIIVKVEDKIKSLGGNLKKTDKWGIRKLEGLFKNAKKLKQGFYALFFFDAETSVPAQLQAYLKVNENVVRYSVYKSLPKKEETLAEIAGVPIDEKAVVVPEAGSAKE